MKRVKKNMIIIKKNDCVKKRNMNVMHPHISTFFLSILFPPESLLSYNIPSSSASLKKFIFRVLRMMMINIWKKPKDKFFFIFYSPLFWVVFPSRSSCTLHTGHKKIVRWLCLFHHSKNNPPEDVYRWC